MTDALQKIAEAHKASIDAFTDYVRERDDKLAAMDRKQDEILQAVQSLRGELRAVSGQSPLQK